MNNLGQEFAEVVINNAFRLWFIPELDRRRADGRIPDGFELRAAQVVMDLNNPSPVVRINEEVRGVLEARAARPIEKGQPVCESDMSELLGMSLTEDDPNAGHATALLHNDVWYLFFDFRYNAARIEQYIDMARQFLHVAGTAARDGQLRPVVENLFATVEILAKCLLMMRPDRSVLESKKHKFVATRFNLEGKLGNVPPDSVQLLNRLTALRPIARYQPETLALTKEDAQTLCVQAQKMLDWIDSARPKRSGTLT